MGGINNVRLTRRDMLRLGAGGAGVFALTASGLAVPRGLASGGGGIYIEAFPTSPLILQAVQRPAHDPEGAAADERSTTWDRWRALPGPDNQDCTASSTGYSSKYQQNLGNAPAVAGRRAPRRPTRG